MHHRFEMTLIVKGEGTRMIGDKVDYFKSGDLILLAPLLPHLWQSQAITPGESVKSISLFFEESFPSKDFQQLTELNAIKEILVLAERGLIFHGDLKKKIVKKLRKLTKQEGLRAILLLLEILQDIAESKDYSILCSEGYSLRKNLDSTRIGKITNYIYENINEPITVDQIAEMGNMHPGSISREFKKSTGYSLIEFINKVRIGNASRLLTETDKPILDICFEVGFQNLSHFNRYFKKVRECTPSEFRKKSIKG